MSLVRRYAYNLPWRGVALGAVFYAGLSVLMAYLARGVAGLTFVCLITLSGMFAVLAFIMMTRRLVYPRVLELADDAVLFPHEFPRTRITRIPYADIIRMSELVVGGQVGLSMVTARGSFEIGSSHLPDIESYRAVRDFICSQASVVMPRHDEREPSAWRKWMEFPEPIIRWVEPKAWLRYRTHLVVSKPLLPRIAKALWFFVRCFVIIVLPWLFLHLFQLSTTPADGYLWLAMAVALFFTSLHWSNATYPARATEISFRDHGITQFSGKQTRDFNYGDCSGWNVVERQFEERVLHILLLRWRTFFVEVALPDSKTRDQLAQLFHDKRIPQAPDLKPSWESRL